MAKLADLKKTCEVLHLHPIPTKNAINKDTGEREKVLSMNDCIRAIQQFYLEQRKQNGTYRKSIEYILAMDSPMLALLIKHKKKEDQDAIWDNNNEDWIWEEKLDGCFNYDTKITLSDGRELPIGYIVENKIDAKVKSYNIKTGKIEAKRIVNWFDNGIKNNFVKLKNGNKYINVTDNHKLFDGIDYTEVSSIKEGYELVYYKDSAFMALLGSIIGDTIIERVTNTSVMIRCSHSIKQKDYLKYKAELFDMQWQKSEEYISGYGSRCISVKSKYNHTFSKALEMKETMFKYNPREYFECMGVIGLAFLFMDDGTNQGNQIKISVNSFSDEQVNALHEYITSLGIQNKVDSEHGYPCIQISQLGARKFSSIVSNYIHPCMKYKLHPEFRNDYFYNIENDISKAHISKVALYIPHKGSYFTDHAYDIEVEDNHNYFADGILVHNCRALLCYDPATGFDMYSRNLSVTDQLPINYGEKILWPKLDSSQLTIPFVLDCEIVPQNKEIDKTGEFVPVADTQLNLISSILSLNEEDSKKVQEKNPVKFVTFDILYLNDKPMFDLTLRQRKEYLHKLLPFLVKAGVPIEEPLTLTQGQDKLAFYNSILNAGGEGVVVKDLNSKYDISGKRAGEWVKIKRSVSQAMSAEGLGDTIDAFVIGFEEGEKGTKNEGKVASLKFGIELLDQFNEPILDQSGDPVTHHIATVGGLTDELKDAITTKDIFGNVALKQEIYGKVASIDGQDLSSRNLRFAHAVLVAWRIDRSANTCKIRKDILEKLVL